MAELEKVINGLECCTKKHPQIICPCVGYPYNEECEDIHPLLNDAIALIRAQQARIAEMEAEQTARVMTLEEMKAAHELDRNDQPPVWVEVLDGKGYWVIASPLGPGAGTHRAISTHGKKWRCWTSRPTDEQREAVKWE